MTVDENAALIAAAPDLYEALRRAQEELRLINMKDTGAIYDVGLRTDISAALAKACPTPASVSGDQTGEKQDG